MKKVTVFLSVPMAGRSEEQIMQEMKNCQHDVCVQLKKQPEEITFLDSFFKDYNPQCGNIGLKFLGKSILCLADADYIYMAPGWEEARGCRLEHDCAAEYGIKVLKSLQDTPEEKKLGNIKLVTHDYENISFLIDATDGNVIDTAIQAHLQFMGYNGNEDRETDVCHIALIKHIKDRKEYKVEDISLSEMCDLMKSRAERQNCGNTIVFW